MSNLNAGAARFRMLGTVFSLAWPTMLEELSQTAVQYIDTAMVGALGTAATAAVGATSTVSWLISSTVSAFGVGFLAFISQSLGGKRENDARRACGQAVLVTLSVGVLLTLLTTSLSSVIPAWMQVDPAIRPMASRYFLILYSPMLFRTATSLFGTLLRAAGDTRAPMRIGVLVNLINILLNFLLIYPCRTVSLFSASITLPGAGWGVEGAAVASAISYVFGGVAMTVVLWRHKTVSPKGQRLIPDKEILIPCFRVTLPNMLQRFATSFGYVVFASMINALGGVSTAAYTIANTVESAFYIPGYGMQTAAATLAGNAYGARDEKRLHTLSRTVMSLEIGLMILSGGLLFFFARPLCSLFSADEQVIGLCTMVLRMVALSEPFYGVTIVIEGMMQGIGNTLTPLVFNITGMWCVRIAGTFICTRFFSLGLVSAWGCMIAHNLFLFLMFTFIYITGRWIKANRKMIK